MSSPANLQGSENTELPSDPVRKFEQYLNSQQRTVDDSSEIEQRQEEDEVEQALESHEVIEIQAFIKHKEWIEEKIQYIEQLPQVDVFAGAEELEKTYDQISTLTTRAQLDDWLREQERIEKETESLDKGDLKKLKALTKAATQRNLSAEDTDLIEITLTTLFALDKLLHLLRDRSELLDLLSGRLTWEEQRALAYKNRAEILDNLQIFLEDRARWKSDVCDSYILDESLPATATTTVEGQLRSTRFKLADELSREIVQFSSRIASLRHGPVAAAGRALDKIIDDSRKPVPDTILDEQDRVEERCDKELSALGKFLMMINMQWKRADEIYTESRKDIISLQAIIDNVQNASKQMPSRQSEASFTSQLDNIKKRILARPDPSSPSASFPRPIHSLFPDYASYNEGLVKTLSTEVSTSRKLLDEASRYISSYQNECSNFEEIEEIKREMLELKNRFVSSLTSLHSRDELDGRSGSRPDLSDPSCVDPIYCQAYLAVLPRLLEDLTCMEQSALRLIKRAHLRASWLNTRMVTEDYIKSFRNTALQLEEELERVKRDKESVSLDVTKLREIQRVWSLMGKLSSSLDSATPTLKDALLRSHWKQQFGGDAAPPTPESPSSGLPSESVTLESTEDTLKSLHKQFSDSIASSTDLVDSLPAPLHDHIVSKRETLSSHFSDIFRLHKLWLDVQGQALVMESIREKAHVLENTIEDLKNQYDNHFEQLLKDPCSDEDTSSTTEGQYSDKELTLSDKLEKTKLEVEIFVKELPTRVPLVSRRPPLASSVSSSDEMPRSSIVRPPIDPALIDRAVRNDTNAYAIRLSGGVSSLVQKRSFVGFYRTARNVCQKITKTEQDARHIDLQLEQHIQLLAEYLDAPTLDDESPLNSLKIGIKGIGSKEVSAFRQSIQTIRDDIAKMRIMPGVQDDVTLLGVLNARVHGLDELSLHSERIQTRYTTLLTEVNRAEQAEAALAAKIAEERRNTLLAHEREREELALAQKERERAEKFALQIDEQVNARLQEINAKQRKYQDTISETEEDVFGPQTPVRIGASKEILALLTSIRSIRKRLKSIGLNSMARCSYPSSPHGQTNNQLPTEEIYGSMMASLTRVEKDTETLPKSSENPATEAELRSLRFEVDASQEMIKRIQQLAQLTSSITICDSAFSELLDCIDNCSSALLERASSTGLSELGEMVTPEEQLSEKISHTKGIFEDMSERFSPVMDDPRAIVEYNRLKQTWEELLEMAQEKLSGRVSRPGSVTAYSSSGRASRASMGSVSDKDSKRSKYMSLSVNAKNGFLAPTLAKRRATSASSAGSSKQSQEPAPRPRSSLTVSRASSRSVSAGAMRPLSPPVPPVPRSYFGSTFASRQRNSSISSNTSSSNQNNKPIAGLRRRLSSLISDAPPRPPSSTGSNRGTWARAPRQSFSSFPREATPDKVQKKTKKYVADPKNKLDVALGDVINNLPVDINVEAVMDTWKDKSGKYWIGGSEPKLCFCRILRSQTVMVRVGGGWVELSRFIKDHFADLFRVLPETPPRPGSRERWISAASLRNKDDNPINRSPKTPGSPDSLSRGVPSFAISTPEGTYQTGSPKGSPLTPIQFMRRADVDATDLSLSSIAVTTGLSTNVLPLGLTTPSKSGMQTRGLPPATPNKVAWRP